VRLDAAPVLDTNRLGDTLVVDISQHVAYCAADDVVNVRAASRDTGSDGPDRLISDGDAPRLLGRDAFEGGPHLSTADFLCLSRLALLQVLADADDRLKSMAQRRM